MENRSEQNMLGIKGPQILDKKIISAKETKQAASANNRAEDSSRRILVVDDEKAIREILFEALSFMGYKVVVASNGIEGLNIFLRSSFDLVLTDYHMSGMDGLSLAFHIKDRSVNTTIVLITGEAKEDVMKKLEGSRVDFVLFKPFGLDEVKETVQIILDN